LEHGELKDKLAPLTVDLEAAEVPGRHWRLPVCYDPVFAPDLAEVAGRTGLTSAQVVERHSAVTYHVYMIGFLPGYPYMGDLPAELVLPRRETPRTRVPPGSVSIATTLTSVYVLDSPGGWHLIGRTPVALWDINRTPPAVLAAGDKVVFRPVSLGEYDTLLTSAVRLTPE
ncbi:MAG: 5-oxoprolinase subunit PxpB, partial [Hyphomicrobiaceae bacterium]